MVASLKIFLNVCSEAACFYNGCSYKEKLAGYDDKLRSLRHKEREYVSLERLKLRTEVRVSPAIGWNNACQMASMKQVCRGRGAAYIQCMCLEAC